MEAPAGTYRPTGRPSACRPEIGNSVDLTYIKTFSGGSSLNVGSENNYRINLNATYQVASTFVLECFGNFNSACSEIQGRYPSFTSYNFAARKQFWHKKGSVAFTTTNPFGQYVNQATVLTGSNFVLNALRQVP